MSDEVERGCGGVPVDDDRLRVHCSRCYRFDTVADHLERARAESAVLRERAERAEFDRDNYKAAWTEVDRGLKENREVLSTALADAAALREQLAGARVDITDARTERDWAHGEIDRLAGLLRTAESLALANGEARGRAEARVATLRNAFCKHCGFAVTADVQEVLTAEHRAAAAEAERDELRGLLNGVARSYRLSANGKCDGGCGSGIGSGCVPADLEQWDRWLRAHPAIPEGTPTDRK